MQAISRALMDPPRCINILSGILCGTLFTIFFFSFVKPNSSISRRDQVIPPSTPHQQQFPLTHQKSKHKRKELERLTVPLFELQPLAPTQEQAFLRKDAITR